MVTKYDEYELDSLMYDIRENGYITINRYKIWRLLGKGSGAAGTWKAFLDAWVELDSSHKRSDLHIYEYDGKYHIGYPKTERMTKWAGET